MVKSEVSRNLLKSIGRPIASLLRVAVCFASVAMLLSFPAARAHNFGQHFGTSQIRQNIVRHTFVAGPADGATEKIAHIDAMPTIATSATVENVAKIFFSRSIVFAVPTFRILHHLKLGSSRSGAPDPLL